LRVGLRDIQRHLQPSLREGLFVNAASTCLYAVAHRRLSRWTFAAVSWTLVGCSDLTNVEAPDVVRPETLANPVGAAAEYAGAVTLFNRAYGTGNLSDVPTAIADIALVSAAGLVADEFTLVTGGAAAVSEDLRTMPEGTGGSAYQALSRARLNSLIAIAALRQFAPQPQRRIGQLFALVGYVELFFAEDFCAGLPLAALVGGQLSGTSSYGSPLTRDQMLELAKSDVDSAEANAGGDAQIVALARVGRGRALINLGRFAEAAVAVGAVPTNFNYSSEHSATVIPNVLSQVTGVTVSDREGTNGLNFRSAGDPRVAVALGTGARSSDYILTKMAAVSSPITVASGVEARLIEAEAALQAGNSGQWLALHNALRATVPGLGPLADPGSASARVDLHFRERAFWLFGTGQRLSDMRRLVRQYGRAADAVFPVGTYKGPGASTTYGTDVTLSPGSGERLNPKYPGCQNRDP
jgi:hypothetical protein